MIEEKLKTNRKVFTVSVIIKQVICMVPSALPRSVLVVRPEAKIGAYPARYIKPKYIEHVRLTGLIRGEKGTGDGLF